MLNTKEKCLYSYLGIEAAGSQENRFWYPSESRAYSNCLIKTRLFPHILLLSEKFQFPDFSLVFKGFTLEK
ncbi:hypothetical protein D3H55_05310 [Bacillus salacetis]|uniref:Uncharacterized protein n=1 Tax=Bacillus salacetis TaxID=2315464 RepID=A0A3A1R320_9BACI|nr:hypothetical protein D3H55_05310 [Bacillus salacetis]